VRSVGVAGGATRLELVRQPTWQDVEDEIA
jgi:hypothetical protein